MRYQDQVVKGTYKALDDIVRAARAVPADRLDWAPGGAARSVLNQMREIAAAGSWFLPIVREGRLPEFAEHPRAEARRIMQGFDTLDKCVEAARASTAELCHAVADFPDDQLECELTLPFGGGTTMTMADILGMHAWNMVYHLGQISQIQLMLGDLEMH
jgi:uncharacterized damage-inducible protein DinB